MISENIIKNTVIFLVLIIFLVYYYRTIRKPAQKCETCDGSGKIWDAVHDSHDLQTVNCHDCGGAGQTTKLKTGRTKKMPISLTKNALKKIKELMEINNPKLDSTTTFLRMGVRGGGCSGFSYLLEFDNETTDKDKIFEFSFPEAADAEPKLKVVVDKKSYVYLNGTTLDYATEGFESGFKFDNPNVKSGSGCGCGQSFSA